MKIWNLLRLHAGARLGLQRSADAFWQRQTQTFLARPEYYERRTQVLLDVLPTIPAQERALDVGCGDGTFTELVAVRAAHTLAYDISEPLILAARHRVHPAIEYHVADIEAVPGPGPFGLVSCIGVLSCIVDPEKYARVCRMLSIQTGPGGYLLLVDTLSNSGEVRRAYRNGYVARYRDRGDYAAAFARGGLDLMVDREIAAMRGGLTNRLMVFRARCD